MPNMLEYHFYHFQRCLQQYWALHNLQYHITHHRSLKIKSCHTKCVFFIVRESHYRASLVINAILQSAIQPGLSQTLCWLFNLLLSQRTVCIDLLVLQRVRFSSLFFRFESTVKVFDCYHFNKPKTIFLLPRVICYKALRSEKQWHWNQICELSSQLLLLVTPP